ncbi:MAG: hypothetical protein K0Q79_487 [Flavipsychrobacter sp.]|jgi:antitoxin component of RelBE/YafQ-DinJ toxin-antitoxin module|nr:hypothetical protein [Flavipsychrobacter sp.]
MTYIVIDKTDKQAEAFLRYVKTLPFAKIQSGENAVTIKAMEQAKKGKVTKHKSSKELIAFLNK